VVTRAACAGSQSPFSSAVRQAVLSRCRISGIRRVNRECRSDRKMPPAPIPRSEIDSDAHQPDAPARVSIDHTPPSSPPYHHFGAPARSAYRHCNGCSPSLAHRVSAVSGCQDVGGSSELSAPGAKDREYRRTSTGLPERDSASSRDLGLLFLGGANPLAFGFRCLGLGRAGRAGEALFEADRLAR
jgi:hypothetical protein